MWPSPTHYNDAERSETSWGVVSQSFGIDALKGCATFNKTGFVFSKLVSLNHLSSLSACL